LTKSTFFFLIQIAGGSKPELVWRHPSEDGAKIK